MQVPVLGVTSRCCRRPTDESWDSWQTVLKVNPLLRVSEPLRRTVLRERDEARKSYTLRRSYEAFRLNRMVDVSHEVLVEVDAWKRVEGREVPPRDGRPIVGVDLGSERSWSGAWALWPNGRSEVYALCPGVPDLDERERQDAMPRGLYRRLHNAGVLLVDEGLRVSRPSVLIDHLLSVGITPAVIYCDRFCLGALQDAVAGRCEVIPRTTRWSEATEDIAAFRRLVADGPLSIVPEGRALAVLALSQASVVSDDQGSCRLQKRRHVRSRDDIAVCGTLACGALVRHLGRGHRPRWRYRGSRMSLHHARLNARRWERTRRRILDSANWRCARCRRYANEVHHRQPLHEGGDPYTSTNLEVALPTVPTSTTTARPKSPAAKNGVTT